MSTSVGIVVLTLRRGLLQLHIFVLKGFLRTSCRRSGAYRFHASSVIYKEGKKDEALKYLKLEIELYPESETYVLRIIKQIGKS